MMTNITKTILGACIALLTLASCSKSKSNFVESLDRDENRKNVMMHAKALNDFTLEDMQEYTAETQRLIFDELTPSNRARLVIERLEAVRDAETSASKIATLDDLIAEITPGLYDETSGFDQANTAVESIVEGMFVSFGYEQTKVIVTTWGGSGALIYGGSGGTYGGGGGASGPEPAAYCGCSTKSDWCSGAGNCTSPGCDAVNGCGTLFRYRCNGHCTLM